VTSFRDEEYNGFKILCMDRIGGVNGQIFCQIGEYFSPQEFVKLSLEVSHPFDKEAELPPAIAKMLTENASRGPDWLKIKRAANLNKIFKLRDELEEKEKLLHKGLQENVEVVVKPKKILLFKALLVEMEYDDLPVVQLLTLGTKIVGLLDKTGIWRPDSTKGVRCSKEVIWKSAKGAQHKIINSRPQRDPEIMKELERITKEEKDSGVLRGPFTADELTKEMGPLWVAARRFGIDQGGKVRAIDDFSEFLVNHAFGSQEKVLLKGVDQIVMWARAIKEGETNDRGFRCRDTSGKVWECVTYTKAGRTAGLIW
jgi:hypothetical protein